MAEQNEKNVFLSKQTNDQTQRDDEPSLDFQLSFDEADPRNKASNENAIKSSNPRVRSLIRWDNYNWPICLKLVHYDLNEIDP